MIFRSKRQGDCYGNEVNFLHCEDKDCKIERKSDFIVPDESNDLLESLFVTQGRVEWHGTQNWIDLEH